MTQYPIGLLYGALVQTIAPVAGGPAWWSEHVSARGWHPLTATLGGRQIAGHGSAQVSIAPIRWRAQWVSQTGHRVALDDGRPGDGWRSRVQVLGWVATGQGGMPVLLTVGGLATDGLLVGLRSHDRAVYDAEDAGGTCLPRHGHVLTLDVGVTPAGGVTVAASSGGVTPPPVVASIDAWLDRHGGPLALDRWAR